MPVVITVHVRIIRCSHPFYLFPVIPVCQRAYLYDTFQFPVIGIVEKKEERNRDYGNNGLSYPFFSDPMELAGRLHHGNDQNGLQQQQSGIRDDILGEYRPDKGLKQRQIIKPSAQDHYNQSCQEAHYSPDILSFEIAQHKSECQRVTAGNDEHQRNRYSVYPGSEFGILQTCQAAGRPNRYRQSDCGRYRIIGERYEIALQQDGQQKQYQNAVAFGFRNPEESCQSGRYQYQKQYTQERADCTLDIELSEPIARYRSDNSGI